MVILPMRLARNKNIQMPEQIICSFKTIKNDGLQEFVHTSYKGLHDSQ